MTKRPSAARAAHSSSGQPSIEAVAPIIITIAGSPARPKVSVERLTPSWATLDVDTDGELLGGSLPGQA
jgi:hypothetical protein